MIAVLLCTYNGEKYLTQQLDSLLNQTFKDFIIYVHDDGSTDHTNIILHQYKKAYTNKFIILEDNKKNRGAKDSFMWLLNKVSADYYMFCDQDDIWLNTKIEDTYYRMLEVENSHKNKPVVIHTDLTLVDKNLNVIFPSFWKYANMNVDISKKFKYLCLGNVVTGCTMMLNNLAKNISLLQTNGHVPLHDYWVALMTAKHGVVENLKKQTILYRQHEYNVVGCGKLAQKKNIIPSFRIEMWRNWYNNNKSFFASIQNKSPKLFVLYRIIFLVRLRLNKFFN